jgi:hypothetical protein
MNTVHTTFRSHLQAAADEMPNPAQSEEPNIHEQQRWLAPDFYLIITILGYVSDLVWCLPVKLNFG